MIDTFSRHRPLSLLAIVVLAQVLLLAFQIKRENNVRLVRYWAVELMTPLERVGTWTFSHVGGVWGGYVGLRNTRAENERLHSEVDKLRLRNRELESRSAEAQRLSTLLNFHDAHPEAPMLAAQVIGASADPTSHTLFINRGERDRLRRNMGVITPDGVVGKVVEVFPSTAQVLLINDKDSGVGALFAVSRTHGVVRGSGDPEPHMEYVVNDEKLQPGDVIVTSGEDRIFPKDLLIGTVGNSKPGSPFQVISVQPAARLDRLEDVIVLLSLQELAPKKTEENSEASGARDGAQPPQSSTPAAKPAGVVTDPRKIKPPATPTSAPANKTPTAQPPAPQQ
ncbi:MAG TPA: rod shape-determining protein MreC [Candidatus Sulfotelmatobacter sp.]|nr:rod shape-determining protein MreC [Candidatus Sulfotelmatobacter sp.]